jgi:hypothetical protein
MNAIRYLLLIDSTSPSRSHRSRGSVHDSVESTPETKRKGDPP